jgi:hypothetical protein
MITEPLYDTDDRLKVYLRPKRIQRRNNGKTVWDFLLSLPFGGI